MSVISFTAAASARPESFDPADWAMDVFSAPVNKMAGLRRLIGHYCGVHPAVAITKPGSRTQQDAVLLHAGRPLKQHFNILRLHRQPYFMGEDEMKDVLFCAAAASLLDDKLITKLRGQMDPGLHKTDGLQDGLRIADAVKNAMACPTLETTDQAFRGMDRRGQIVFTLLACQFARTYIDIKTTNSPLNARFNTPGGAEMLRNYRARLALINRVLLPQNSAMAGLYRSMLYTIVQLAPAAPVIPALNYGNKS